MKRYLCLFAFVFSCSAQAKPVSFEFNSVPVSTFAQATFRAILKRDYVMAPELVSGDKRITLNVAAIDEQQVSAFVEGVLEQQGIAVTEKQGIYYLSTAKQAPAAPDVTPSVPATVPEALKSALPVDLPPDAASLVYQPQNRSSDFLVTVLSNAFGARSAIVAGSNILLSGTEKDIAKMVELLSKLDAMPKLVDVSASWVEVTDTASNGRGISVMANVLGAKLGVALGPTSSASAISLKHANFQLVLDALNTDSRFKQVSNSRVVGDDYEKLTLTVGDETPTIASTGKDNAGNTVQNIAYRPSGVIVDVTPRVLGNGRIRLVVDGQISNFKQTLTGVTSSPTLLKRQVKTTVTVGDGEVLLIGGLNDSQKSDTASRLPFLPASWVGRSGSSVNSDLVLVLSAKVASVD